MKRTLVRQIEDEKQVLEYLVRVASSVAETVAVVSKFQREGVDLIRRMKESEGFPSDLVTEDRKTSIRFVNGGRIIMNTMNENSFKGYSIRTLYVPSLRRHKLSKWRDFKDSAFPALSSRNNAEVIISL